MLRGFGSAAEAAKLNAKRARKFRTNFVEGCVVDKGVEGELRLKWGRVAGSRPNSARY